MSDEVAVPLSSAQGMGQRRIHVEPRDIPLPPPFRNDGNESFQMGARRYEVIQEARYRGTNVDLDAVLAAELPTRLAPDLFIVWDNLPRRTQQSYDATKRHLHEVFGQKDVIASFQTFTNSRFRLPNEPMDVYAADVCRLVKEAFPDFEHNASEYMKMSRFLAGLDQELQIKCHERGVKTFQEAVEIATQAERARQAAKLVTPFPSTSIAPAQSVNTVSNSDVFLRKAVQELTATVSDLSRNLAALKLKVTNHSGENPYDKYTDHPHHTGGVQQDIAHLHGIQLVNIH